KASIETLLGEVRNLHRLVAVLIAITVVNGLVTAFFVKSQFALVGYLLMLGVAVAAFVFSIRVRRNHFLIKAAGVSVSEEAPLDISAPSPKEIHPSIPISQAESETISHTTLDVEKEIVVRMAPLSRRTVKVRINSIQRATPRVVYDPPDA
ncbi:MAG: hypothetical protein ACREEM_53815, partial [Blastocatellia bacterium]